MVPLEVIYEDENCMAVNKPSGLLVHAARQDAADGMHEPTVVDWFRANRPEVLAVGDDPALRPGIVHRLDKETSGVLLVAKSQQYYMYLKSLFQERGIKKTYLAVVGGKLKARVGTIDQPIGIVSGSTKRSIRSSKMMKEAMTDYRVLCEQEWPSVQWTTTLEVSPRTGRTHQIRVHLAALGHPVLGDAIYGKRYLRTILVPRLMLHALSLEFVAETGKRVKIEAPPPPEFLPYLSTAGGQGGDSGVV
jgi:23S rRNA pseudouridine1911/1915/1917 synthase